MCDQRFTTIIQISWVYTGRINTDIFDRCFGLLQCHIYTLFELRTISLILTWFVSIPQLKPWGSPIVGCESSEAVFCNSKFFKSWRLLELKVTLMGFWAQQIFCFGSNILARDNKVPVMTVNNGSNLGPLTWCEMHGSREVIITQAERPTLKGFTESWTVWTSFTESWTVYYQFKWFGCSDVFFCTCRFSNWWTFSS